MDNKLKTAIYLKEVGGLRQSINLLKEHIRETPSNIEVHGQLIHALALNNQDKEAWFYLKKAETVEQYNPIILSHRARLLLKEKKVEEAFKVIQFAFNRDNNSAFVLLTFSNILNFMGAIDKAKEAVNLAIKADPQLAEAYALRAIYYNNEGERTKALQDAKNALLLKSHIRVLESITADNNIREAIEVINDVLKSVPKKQSIILLNKLANYQYKIQNLDKAIDSFQQILNLAPNSTESRIKIANILTQKGEHERAVEHYLIAKTQNTSNVQIFNNLALCYRQMGEIGLAIENYREALALNPSDSHIASNFANLMIGEEKYESAIEILKNALKINPNGLELYTALGFCFREMGELDKALEETKKALHIKTDSGMVHHKIAGIYMGQGELEKAIESLHTALGYYLEDLEKVEIITPPMATTYMDTKNAEATLKKVHKAFERKNTPFFLVYGTLLGVVREGGILPHDKDMDIGIDWDVPRELIEEIFIDAGLEIKKTTLEDKDWMITGKDKKLKISIDAFFYKSIDNKMVSGFEAKPYPLVWEFPKFELVEYEWSGYTWLIPDPYEEYFESCYGKNWRIPDKAFDTVVSAYNLAPKSREFSICIGLSRLVGNIKKSNYSKVKGYCMQLLPIHDYPILHQTMEKMEFILDEFEKLKDNPSKA